MFVRPKSEETLIAANPFDDTPPPQRSMPPMISNSPMNHGMLMQQQYMQHSQFMRQSGYMNMMPSSDGYNMNMNVMTPGIPAGGMSSLNSRVYPADQPMIFSATNPNAPPIFPCGNCHKEIHENDHAIMCESGCNFWYHKKCSGLTDDAFKILQKEPCAEWVCDKCCNEKPIQWVKFK